MQSPAGVFISCFAGARQKTGYLISIDAFFFIFPERSLKVTNAYRDTVSGIILGAGSRRDRSRPGDARAPRASSRQPVDRRERTRLVLCAARTHFSFASYYTRNILPRTKLSTCMRCMHLSYHFHGQLSTRLPRTAIMGR